MVDVLAVAAVVVLATGAEQLHRQRCRRVAALAFGPSGRPAPWVRFAPWLRVAALAALCWGLVTLLLLPPKVHNRDETAPGDYRHLVLLLDVSPSMKLEDAGPTGKQARTKRTAELLQSFFERVPIAQYRTSVVAVYNGAKPVVTETTDLEVVRNILNDLPMHYAFPRGGTDLFAGLQEVARLAHPWQPRSTTVIIVSDGDTVPATGMSKMPASVAHVVVAGVGDPVTGKFIAGHQSRQDASTLRQLAVRLNGTYHNGNARHLSSDLLREITAVGGKGVFERLTRREYALIACAGGAVVWALLPWFLHVVGTRWRPGVPAPSPEPRRATVPRKIAQAV